MSYYYETHVTIEFPGEEHIETLKNLARVNDFHMGNLLLMKNEEERSRKDLFFTARNEYNSRDEHDRNMSLARAVASVDLFCRQLLLSGYKVVRYKIEDAIFDSRIEDSLDLMRYVQTQK